MKVNIVAIYIAPGACEKTNKEMWFRVDEVYTRRVNSSQHVPRLWNQYHYCVPTFTLLIDADKKHTCEKYICLPGLLRNNDYLL